MTCHTPAQDMGVFGTAFGYAKKAQFYVWYLGSERCDGVRGEAHVRPAMRQLLRDSTKRPPNKVTVQVGAKGVKLTQCLPTMSRSGRLRMETVKYRITTDSLTFTIVGEPPYEDVVACIVVALHSADRSAVRVHCYRCDSAETASVLHSRLQSLLDEKGRQEYIDQLEGRLLESALIGPPRRPMMMDSQPKSTSKFLSTRHYVNNSPHRHLTAPPRGRLPHLSVRTSRTVSTTTETTSNHSSPYQQLGDGLCHSYTSSSSDTERRYHRHRPLYVNRQQQDGRRQKSMPAPRRPYRQASSHIDARVVLSGAGAKRSHLLPANECQTRSSLFQQIRPKVEAVSLPVALKCHTILIEHCGREGAEDGGNGSSSTSGLGSSEASPKKSTSSPPTTARQRHQSGPGHVNVNSGLLTSDIVCPRAGADSRPPERLHIPDYRSSWANTTTTTNIPASIQPLTPTSPLLVAQQTRKSDAAVVQCPDVDVTDAPKLRLFGDTLTLGRQQGRPSMLDTRRPFKPTHQLLSLPSDFTIGAPLSTSFDVYGQHKRQRARSVDNLHVHASLATFETPLVETSKASKRASLKVFDKPIAPHDASSKTTFESSPMMPKAPLMKTLEVPTSTYTAKFDSTPKLPKAPYIHTLDRKPSKVSKVQDTPLKSVAPEALLKRTIATPTYGTQHLTSKACSRNAFEASTPCPTPNATSAASLLRRTKRQTVTPTPTVTSPASPLKTSVYFGVGALT